MLKYKLDKDPYDDRVLFTGKLNREISPGFTVLVGCNGSGKTTVLNYIKDKYKHDDNYKIFSWSNTKDKSISKDAMLESQNYDILASLAFSSEGEEINTNIGILASRIGRFKGKNEDKNLIVLLDGIDSGLSIDLIDEMKDFFKNLVIPDVEKEGRECYVIVTANEYELACDEHCIDARSGKEITFDSYEEYRKYILHSRKLKDESRK